MARTFTMTAGQGKADVTESSTKTVSGDLGIVVDWTKFSGTTQVVAELQLIIASIIKADTSLT